MHAKGQTCLWGRVMYGGCMQHVTPAHAAHPPRTTLPHTRHVRSEDAPVHHTDSPSHQARVLRRCTTQYSVVPYMLVKLAMARHSVGSVPLKLLSGMPSYPRYLQVGRTRTSEGAMYARTAPPNLTPCPCPSHSASPTWCGCSLHWWEQPSSSTVGCGALLFAHACLCMVLCASCCEHVRHKYREAR
jgi:hypothetical protein